MTAPTGSDNPYVGPRTFSTGQRNLFFGRDREARDLVARVLSERLVLFYSQSGAGKSSLINTCLIPDLEAAGYTVLPVARVGGEQGAAGADVINIFVYNAITSIVKVEADRARLGQLTLSAFLAGLTTEDGKTYTYEAPVGEIAGDGQPSSRPYVLIFDQFEELVTTHLSRWSERADFFRQLNAAMLADPNLWVVLALREDYVAPLEPFAPLLADRMRARFYMERMSVEAALQAIRRPAELFHRQFAPGVAEQLVEDLRQVRVPGQEETVAGQYVEPVQLQVVCRQLWENIKSRPLGQITAEDRREAGDVNESLIKFYEESIAFAVAEPVGGISERLVRSWFDKELITPAGTRGLVRQGEETTGSLPNAVVRRLQSRFLVRTELRGGDAWIELVHDRLVEPIQASNRAWFARNLNAVSLAAEAWSSAQHDPARLFAGPQLATAAAQLRAQPQDYSDLEREFIEEGQKAEAQRTSRRQRAVAWTATAVAAAFILLTLWAFASRGAAIAAANSAATAQAQAVAAGAQAVAAGATADANALLARAASTQAVANASTARAANADAVASARTAQAESVRAQVARDKALEEKGKLNVALVELAAQATQLAVLSTGTPTPTPPSTRAVSTPTPTRNLTPAPVAGFVQAVGSQFVTAGRPFRFVGVNLRGLVHYGQSPGLPFADARTQLKAARAMGARVVRVILPYAEISTDQTIARLRTLLSMMKAEFPDVYLIVVLGNAYSDTSFRVPGDDRYYNLQPGGQGFRMLGLDWFRQGYRDNYLPFVEQVVRAFRDEPQILAWELGYELKAHEAPELLITFMHAVAARIKAIDRNHLVGPGIISTRHVYMAGNEALRIKLYDTPLLDYISNSVYHDIVELRARYTPSIEDDSDLARRLQKPWLIDENGLVGGPGDDRSGWLEAELDAVFGKGAVGYMQWGFMVGPDSDDGDSVIGMDQIWHNGDWDQFSKLYTERARQFGTQIP